MQACFHAASHSTWLQGQAGVNICAVIFVILNCISVVIAGLVVMLHLREAFPHADAACFHRDNNCQI